MRFLSINNILFTVLLFFSGVNTASVSNISKAIENEYKLKKEFATFYHQLNQVNLPLENNYDVPQENDGFMPVPQKYVFLFNRQKSDTDFQAIKLPEKQGIKFILLSLYRDSGSPVLVLYSLSAQFDLIDSLLLSDEYELENGRVVISYKISNTFNITLKKTEYIDAMPKRVIEKKEYIINRKGIFIKI